MKLSELKEIIDSGNFSIDKLDIKKYIGVLVKKIVISKIIEDSEENENGIIYFDHLNKEISTDLAILLNYTDVYIDEDMPTETILDIYDLMKANDVFNLIEDVVGEDLYMFNVALSKEIDNIKLRNNTIESVIAKGLNKFITMMDKNTNPKEIKSILKQAQKLDFDKIPIIKEVMNNLSGKQN